ncbi:hypothetical protein [Massilia orientalis]|uniref:Uncharacterized protein n=1 Tax=Massilia orientalis TaxID=3050128 RepID=A0ACC7MDF5_9BURK|nr:hypothetical protein [Massilia sp. YIM B02787]
MADQHPALTLAGQHVTGSHNTTPAAGAGRYIVGDWSHIFADDGPATDVRIVFDTNSRRLVAMQIHTHRGYVDAGRAQLADVQDSLLTANAHVIESPVVEGFHLAAEMPDWSASERRNAAIVQFEREIAFSKVQHGQLIETLVFELEAGSDEATDEFRWDVVDSAKSNLGTAAANASTDDAADQEAAIANAEAWVADRIANGSLADIVATSIALGSADETQATVFDLLAAPAPTAAP